MNPQPRAAEPVIELTRVEKVYRNGRVGFPALSGVDLTITAGEMVAVTGPSGSGKSTIVNLIAGIDRPTAGTVMVAGRHLKEMGEEQLAAWRGRTVGIVFQFFQLMPTLTAAENAALPLDLARIGPPRERTATASRNLAAVGLAGRGSRLPLELSGGEQQRVAIARAMACQPPILLGDELTGNLDSGMATVPVGGTLDVRAASGATAALRVSGTGLNLAYTPGANSTGTPVFYTSVATAQALSGTRGYNHLGFRLTDDSLAAQNRVIAEVRAYLTAQTGSDPVTSLPYTRAPGYWPGQTGFSNLMAVLYIITALALGSALFLIAATMNTLIAEQAREIAILRALGARSRHIRRTFTTEAVAATLAGRAAGILLGWLIYQGLLILVRHDAHTSLPQDFQPTIPLITLAGVLVLTLIVIRGPLHRANRIQPGAALRYQ